MEYLLDNDDIALLNLLTPEQKSHALNLYAPREKKTSTAYILWVLVGCHYFYLGHPFKNLLLWLLMSCFIGEIWWVVDLFRMKGLVREKNKEILDECVKEAQNLYPSSTIPPVRL